MIQINGRRNRAQIVRGTRFYHPTLINVSDHYARFLAGKGEVTIATIVR